MDLITDDVYVQDYHKDVLRSIQLGHSYFISLDYLVIKSWICPMSLYVDNIIIDGPDSYRYRHLLSGVLRYNLYGVLCHYIVAVLNLANNVGIAVFSIV